LLGSILSLFGLYKFTTAFFLAKKSMPHKSSCEPDSARNLLYDVLGLSKENIENIENIGILSKHRIMKDKSLGKVPEWETQNDIQAPGCWMPRRVDAIALIVVDALRFDFALEHLPKSVGARLVQERERNARRQKKELENEENGGSRDRISDGDQIWTQKDVPPPLGQSQLYQFVADPPTVTMQRLKGLTTGGLPTFADISGSFGGATVDEDSWVQQLHDIPASRRGISTSLDTASSVRIKQHETFGRARAVQMAFVGDDTWVDLFPTQFDDSHPFPSFNTRDLDTVDDGCLLHLPRLLNSFGSNSYIEKMNDERRRKEEHGYFEMLVTHFLGVDHVGHTYGPNNV
jgi:phosphatidylinositol glycan class O